MTHTTQQSTPGGDTGSFAARLADRLPQLPVNDNPIWVARAAGTLDVMGGIAEHAGALTLSAATDEVVYAAIAPRQDQVLHLVCLESAPEQIVRQAGENGSAVTEANFALSAFYDINHALARPSIVRQLTSQITCDRKRAALFAAYGLLLDGCVPHLHGGFTVVIECGISSSDSGCQAAVIQAAVVQALAQALGFRLTTQQSAAACRTASAAMSGCPYGAVTPSAPLLARPGVLLPVCSETLAVGDSFPLPPGVTLVGIDSGVRRDPDLRKYASARTAALMGREIVRHLLAGPAVGTATTEPAAPWGGVLARIPVTDYVDQLRDRLPTKLRGARYLERFGPLSDLGAEVIPQTDYKVRSRTEHHVYEDDRVRQFAERLTFAARTHREHPLVEAGDLMYASHWSYGQRCGLGSIETDLLVNLIRSAGVKAGIYGARVSGAGAGGTVVVLLRDDPVAINAITVAMQQYQQQTQRRPRLRSLSRPT